MITRVLLLAGLFVSIQVNGQQNLRGLTFENERYDHSPIHPDYGKFEKLPASVSNKNYFPRVVNQSLENNAVAWTATWYGLGALQKRFKPSKKINFSPSFTYRMCHPDTKDCNDPISLIDALQSLTVNGAPEGNFFGMFCVESTPAFTLDSARQNKLAGYVRLFNTYDPKSVKVQSIKRALVAKNPVAIGFICPASFQLAKEFWQPREKPLIENGGHTLCVVGYDDLKYGGAFEVVNSWGKGWGQEGYTWLRYDDVEAFVLYGFEMLGSSPYISADVDFITSTGEEMKVDFIKPGVYRFARPYKTGEQFKMKISSRESLFGMVMAADPAGQVGNIYPGSVNISPLLAKEITLPLDAPYLELQGTPGENTIIGIFSANLFSLQECKALLSKDGIKALSAISNSGTWFKTKTGFKDADRLVVLQIGLIQE